MPNEIQMISFPPLREPIDHVRSRTIDRYRRLLDDALLIRREDLEQPVWRGTVSLMPIDRPLTRQMIEYAQQQLLGEHGERFERMLHEYNRAFLSEMAGLYSYRDPRLSEHLSWDNMT